MRGRNRDVVRIRLLVSDVCNMLCEYCHVFQDVDRISPGQMSPETARAVIDAYAMDPIAAKSSHFLIELYGGEPLVNWKTVREAVTHARRQLGETRTAFVLNTNATLVRTEHAKFCAEMGIDVHVGMDGPDAESNMARQTKTKKPTVEQTIRGIERLKKAGCRVQLNTCITGNNREALHSLIDFAKERTIDRVYVALTDTELESAASEDEIDLAGVLIDALAYARKKDVTVTGPWVRAIFSSYIEEGSRGTLDKSEFPYISFDARGEVFLFGLQDSSLGCLLGRQISDVLQTEKTRYLSEGWASGMKDCASCTLEGACNGYLRSLVKYHKGSDSGYERECRFALRVLEDYPKSFGGKKGFSDGLSLKLSGQVQLRKHRGGLYLLHRLAGKERQISLGEWHQLRGTWELPQIAEEVEGMSLPLICNYMEEGALIPAESEEELQWLNDRVRFPLQRRVCPGFDVLHSANWSDKHDTIVSAVTRSLDEVNAISGSRLSAPFFTAVLDDGLYADFLVNAQIPVPKGTVAFVVLGKVLVLDGEALQEGELLEQLGAAFRHELGHILVAERRYSLPIWIEEGLCEYLARGCASPGDRGPEEAVLSLAHLEALNIDSLMELCAVHPNENPYYQAAWLFVSELVRSHGKLRFWDVLERTAGNADFPSSFFEVYGVLMEKAEEQWSKELFIKRAIPRVTENIEVIAGEQSAILINSRRGAALRVDVNVLGEVFPSLDRIKGRQLSLSELEYLSSQGLLDSMVERQILVLEGEGPIKVDLNSALQVGASESYVSNLRLNMTEVCNMRCTYCYLDHENTSRKMLSAEMATEAIDQFFSQARTGGLEELNVRFFGGEPLLNWSVIEDSLAHMRRLGNGFEIRKTLNTNGLNLTGSIIDTLVNHEVQVIVSVDGIDEVNDINRRLKNGRGTFDRVKKSIEMLLARRATVGLAVTFSAFNLRDINKVIDWVAELQHQYRCSIPVGLNGVSMKNFDEQSPDMVDYKVEAIIDAIRHAELKGVDLSPSKILRPWNALLGRERVGAYCSAIGNELTINPDGSVSPCGALPMAFGRVENLKEVTNSTNFTMLKERRGERIQGCRGCVIEAYCGGGCAADSNVRSGSIFSPDQDCGLRINLFRRMVKEFAL